MMNVVVCFVVLVASVAASGKESYGKDSGAYNGKYSGKCGADGFYDADDYSFVICSNGNAYKQPCPPGSRNSGSYTAGKHYSAHSFCDVNLVDSGYAAKHGRRNSYGAGYGEPSYGKNNYGYGKKDYGYGNQGYGYGGRDSYGYGVGYGNNDYEYGNNNYGYGNRGYSGYSGYGGGYGAGYRSGYGGGYAGYGDNRIRGFY